jgi:hypothetical protein
MQIRWCSCSLPEESAFQTKPEVLLSPSRTPVQLNTIISGYDLQLTYEKSDDNVKCGSKRTYFRAVPVVACCQDILADFPPCEMFFALHMRSSCLAAVTKEESARAIALLEVGLLAVLADLTSIGAPRHGS